MNLSVVLGISLITTVIYVILKQQKPEIAMFALLLGGILILTYLLNASTPIFDSVMNIINKANIDSDFAQIPIKALGISIVTQLAGDCCRDSGTASVASKVEIAGKVAILIITIPLFEQILNIAVNLING